MEPTQKTFLERLQIVQDELRVIARSDEFRWLVQTGTYDPEVNILDANQAIRELLQAYEILQGCEGSASILDLEVQPPKNSHFEEVFEKLQLEVLISDPEP